MLAFALLIRIPQVNQSKSKCEQSTIPSVSICQTLRLDWLAGGNPASLIQLACVVVWFRRVIKITLILPREEYECFKWRAWEINGLWQLASNEIWLSCGLGTMVIAVFSYSLLL